MPILAVLALIPVVVAMLFGPPKLARTPSVAPSPVFQETMPDWLQQPAPNDADVVSTDGFAAPAQPAAALDAAPPAPSIGADTQAHLAVPLLGLRLPDFLTPAAAKPASSAAPAPAPAVSP